MGKPGVLQSMGLQRVGHNLVTEQWATILILFRRCNKPEHICETWRNIFSKARETVVSFINFNSFSIFVLFFLDKKCKCRRQVSHCARGSGATTKKLRTCHQLASRKERKKLHLKMSREKPEVWQLLLRSMKSAASIILKFNLLRNSFSINHTIGFGRSSSLVEI